jgi:hypothetical protein
MINGFMPVTTPMSAFEEFTASSRDEADDTTGLVMDWGQLHFSPSQMEMRSDLLISTPIGNPLGMAMDGMHDPSMMAMLPEFGQSMSSMSQAPVPSRLRMSASCTGFSDLELASSNASMGSHTRHTSISEPIHSIGSDLEAVILAQNGWNCFRAIPTLPPSQCPRTGRLHLEKLESSLRCHETWRSWSPSFEGSDLGDHLSVTELNEYSRDKLLAITQTFLYKAVETHRNTNGSNGSQTPGIGAGFVLLPPIKVLKYFLRSYANTFERFFPMTSRGTLDVNEQIMNPNIDDRAASLQTLMMIAAGSLYVPSMEARLLNGGLTEACRISLFDLVETNVSMASDQSFLHSALLFTATAAWGGDKWHMNMAMGQRGMYAAMLRHSGALESIQSELPAHASSVDIWQDWLAKEKRSR